MNVALGRRVRLAGFALTPILGDPQPSPRAQSPLDLIASTERGLYCAAGDFHIDPWRPVPRAIITHAHSDHARFGSEVYVCHRDTAPILRKRLGDVTIETATYGQILTRNGVEISFHPAGHVLGSAQVRVASKGEIWVASGDYKLESDGVSPAFEPIRCHAFITESTFGLPIYRWRPQADIFAAIDAWRRENIAAGRASILFAYALGKAQRLHRPCRSRARADRLSRRGRGDQRALSRGGSRPAADPLATTPDCDPENKRDFASAAHCRAALGRREPVAQALRRLFRRAGERLDAGAGKPPPARARPRLCAFRPRRLAGPHRRHRGDGRGAHSRDARIHGAVDAIPPREGF